MSVLWFVVFVHWNKFSTRLSGLIVIYLDADRLSTSFRETDLGSESEAAQEPRNSTQPSPTFAV